jgi:hypothetical protein
MRSGCQLISESKNILNRFTLLAAFTSALWENKSASISVLPFAEQKKNWGTTVLHDTNNFNKAMGAIYKIQVTF